MAFARMSKITNAKGRAAYITDEKRQEKILHKSPAVDWQPYIDHERNHRKNDRANIEARELIISLPNSMSGLQPGELEEQTRQLAEFAIEKRTDYQYAVHWNKERTNLHMHVMFSEREKTGEVTRYDRDIYHTASGKIARAKKERAKDASGNDKPPVHRKGEVSNAGLSDKGRKYSTTEWAAGVDDRINRELTRMGYPQPERGDLHQLHQGRGSDSAAIAAKNEYIRATNDALRVSSDADQETIRAEAIANLKATRGKPFDRWVKSIKEIIGRVRLYVGQMEKSEAPQPPVPDKPGLDRPAAPSVLTAVTATADPAQFMPDAVAPIGGATKEREEKRMDGWKEDYYNTIAEGMDEREAANRVGIPYEAVLYYFEGESIEYCAERVGEGYADVRQTLVEWGEILGDDYEPPSPSMMEDFKTRIAERKGREGGGDEGRSRVDGGGERER